MPRDMTQVPDPETILGADLAGHRVLKNSNREHEKSVHSRPRGCPHPMSPGHIELLLFRYETRIRWGLDTMKIVCFRQRHRAAPGDKSPAEQAIPENTSVCDC